MAVSDLIVKAAMEYAAIGWRVVPLQARDKRPRINAWQREASSDEERVAGWFERWPDSNVGVKLGSDSGIIDVECDDDAAEETLTKVFGGDVPVTPTFAASRGKHRLFRWTDKLPEPGKAVFKIGKLEFRTGNGNKGAQSVFPPSLHPSGAQYKWLVRPEDAVIAELSDAVIGRIWNFCGLDTLTTTADRKPPEHWDRITSGVAFGELHDAAVSLIGKLFTTMADPFDNSAVSVQWMMIDAWNQNNKPPIEEEKLRRWFEDIWKREKQRRTDLQYQDQFSKEAKPKLSVGEQARNDGWRLVIRDAKPKIYLLFSPLWEGSVEATSGGLLSSISLRRLVLEQKSVCLPNAFKRLWEGTRDTPSLLRQLVEAAELGAAALEQHRDRVVASLLLDQIKDATPVDEAHGVDHRGRPQRLSDGSVVFSFTRVWRELAFGPDKVTRLEMSSILETVKAEPYRDNGGSTKRLRFKRMARDAIEKLESLTG
jgi:hypothetical protein